MTENLAWTCSHCGALVRNHQHCAVCGWAKLCSWAKAPPHPLGTPLTRSVKGFQDGRRQGEEEDA